MKKTAFSIAGSLLVLASAAHAADKRGPLKDPNKIICRSDNSTGSRLSQTKQCLTAAQWEEQRQANRNDVEKIQTNRYKND